MTGNGNHTNSLWWWLGDGLVYYSYSHIIKTIPQKVWSPIVISDQIWSYQDEVLRVLYRKRRQMAESVLHHTKVSGGVVLSEGKLDLEDVEQQMDVS